MFTFKLLTSVKDIKTLTSIIHLNLISFKIHIIILRTSSISFQVALLKITIKLLLII